MQDSWSCQGCCTTQLRKAPFTSLSSMWRTFPVAYHILLPPFVCRATYAVSMSRDRDICGYGFLSDNCMKAVSRHPRTYRPGEHYLSYLSCGFLLARWGSQSIFPVYWWPQVAQVFRPIPELWSALWRKMPHDVLSLCCPTLVLVPCGGSELSAPLLILCINQNYILLNKSQILPRFLKH